jgi:hypothetical protein
MSSFRVGSDPSLLGHVRFRRAFVADAILTGMPFAFRTWAWPWRHERGESLRA